MAADLYQVMLIPVCLPFLLMSDHFLRKLKKTLCDISKQ